MSVRRGGIRQLATQIVMLGTTGDGVRRREGVSGTDSRLTPNPERSLIVHYFVMFLTTPCCMFHCLSTAAK